MIPLDRVAHDRALLLTARARFEDSVRQARDAGHSLGQIAAAAGVTRGAIQQILKK
jgi:hypothetical protein